VTKKPDKKRPKSASEGASDKLQKDKKFFTILLQNEALSDAVSYDDSRTLMFKHNTYLDYRFVGKTFIEQ